MRAKSAQSGEERILFDAAAAPVAGEPTLTALEARPLPHALVDAADAAAPAAAAAAALIGAAAGAEEPTLASTAVWSRLTAALTAHDWNAARTAKHAVEEAQRVRHMLACIARRFAQHSAPALHASWQQRHACHTRCWADALLRSQRLASQAARKEREANGVAWQPRFFAPNPEAPGTWMLKPGVAEALTAAAGLAPGGVPPQPPTPDGALRRTATA